MKIVSWNCNGALRKKFLKLTELGADIYIIQECEDPKKSIDIQYRDWAFNHLWIGNNKNKGLGIFAKPEIILEPLDWSNQYENHLVNYFLPCLVNHKYQLLGAWAHHNNSPTFGYIGQFWKYLEINFSKFESILIAGDFNSNVIWDKWDRWWNHSDILKTLDRKSIKSIYHSYFNEEQGKESKPTFFLQRNQNKPYHIDYFFGSPYFQFNNHFEIGDISEWIVYSDHLPIMLEIRNQ